MVTSQVEKFDAGEERYHFWHAQCQDKPRQWQHWIVVSVKANGEVSLMNFGDDEADNNSQKSPFVGAPVSLLRAVFTAIRNASNEATTPLWFIPANPRLRRGRIAFRHIWRNTWWVVKFRSLPRYV